jgi:tRNA pseudouridine55 synthase
MKLGIETDTQDYTGRIINEVKNFNISEKDIHKVFKLFTGRIKQLPPLYSAKKVKGIPLYKYARKGIDVKRDKKTVEVYEITPINLSIPFIIFKVRCSKGTYIRTLVSDIGERLGTFACLVELRRIRSGIFKIEDAITINRLKEDLNKGGVRIWH